MRNFVFLLLSIVTGLGFIYILQGASGRFPAIGALLDPVEGLYYNARTATHPSSASLYVTGLSGDVQVVRDDRGVPHIFADNDLDAVTALGYAVAQDRLFQLDFIPRVASGSLSEILGPGMVETDRFLRQTGMEWGAQKNLERVSKERGEEYQLIEAYVRGINTYIDGMAPKDLPFEFKLLGYEPQRYTPIHVIRILQYMTFDLTYGSDDAEYGALISSLAQADYQELYPQFARLFVPIIPETGGQIQPQDRRPILSEVSPSVRNLMASRHAFQKSLSGTPLEGFINGKGSNNWAVGPGKSTTGGAILAGDMHLSLWLPSIWYEVHLVTPSMNTYGVTIPGAPLPVEAFNDHLGWAFTNTGSDQIDHFALTLDDSGDEYLLDGSYVPLQAVPDTILVKGEDPVLDTLYYAKWGPVIQDEEGAVAIRWVAHDSSRTLRAQWGMNRAQDFESFQAALKYWDTPMQNILYADIEGNIAIRSTGYLPIRRGKHGMGLLDGASDRFEWIGRVPFDELPYSYNPDQQFLSSTNQQPADSTYPYYQGHNWGPGYRSLRIDALMRGKDKHSVDDLKRYQSDVYAVQRDLFAPMLKSVEGLSEKAGELRDMLLNWEGEADVDRPEPLILDIYLDRLEELVWDEPVFQQIRQPNQERLLALLNGELRGAWEDVVATGEREQVSDLLAMALEKTVEELETSYGWDRAAWRWGDHHKVVFRHFTRSDALRALWRGPFEYPGFASTLSPARSRTTTHSASWRVVVDFSTDTPTGYGVYPGGQSGNPFSEHYDAHLDHYLSFKHYSLLRPSSAQGIPAERISSSILMASTP